MKTKALIIVCLFSFLSCQTSSDVVDYIELRTVSNHQNVEKSSLRIKEKNEYSDLIKIIDKRKKIPVKFRPIYEIEIVYKSGEKEIYLLQDEYIKINGISYKLPSNKLDSLIEKHFLEKR